MLLDVSCTVEDFNKFLEIGMNADIKPDFDMEGRDKYSGFGLSAYKPDYEEITEYSEEISGEEEDDGEESSDFNENE